MTPPESADTVAHQPWHMLVPASISNGFGWCLDCQRTVPHQHTVAVDDDGHAWCQFCDLHLDAPPDFDGTREDE